MADGGGFGRAPPGEGLTSAALKDLWNAADPGDPIPCSRPVLDVTKPHAGTAQARRGVFDSMLWDGRLHTMEPPTPLYEMRQIII